MRSIKLEDTDTPIDLTFGAQTVSQGAPKSLELLTDLSDYTVTTGKTAKLVLILGGNSGQVDVQFKVWESSSADTATGTAKYTYAGDKLDSLNLITVSPDWDAIPKTFAAGKYITIEVTSTGDSVSVLGATVIES